MMRVFMTGDDLVELFDRYHAVTLHASLLIPNKPVLGLPVGKLFAVQVGCPVDALPRHVESTACKLLG